MNYLHTTLSEWEANGGPKNLRSRMDFRPDSSIHELLDNSAVPDGRHSVYKRVILDFFVEGDFPRVEEING